MQMTATTLRASLADTGPSILDSYVQDDGPLEKMSKSRGNCVTVDMAVFGIASIKPGYEFRDMANRTISNWKRCSIWRDRNGDGCFYTGPAFGTLPVFLCKSDEIIPARLLIDGVERMQHGKQRRFWAAMAEAFPDEFHDVESEFEPLEVPDHLRAGIYCKHDR
jgi:hypothetical protein